MLLLAQRAINRRFHVFSSFRFVIVVIQFSRFGAPKHIGVGGDSEIRTSDPLLARQVLSQLSYTPGVSVRNSRFNALLR